jgi:hypothetical protein
VGDKLFLPNLANNFIACCFSAKFELPMRNLAAGPTRLLLVIILLVVGVFGDVAPEIGYKRVSVKLQLETNDDLSGYRFFMRSGNDAKEVFLKKGEKTTVAPLGGGAFYSAGKLLAVPAAELQKLNGEGGPERQNEIERAVYQGKVTGRIELVDHLFSRTVPNAEADSFEDPLYRIEKDAQAGLKAVHVSGGAAVSSDPSAKSSGRLFWQSIGAAVVAGVFLAFGLAILGILYFRKKAKSL